MSAKSHSAFYRMFHLAEIPIQGLSPNFLRSAIRENRAAKFELLRLDTGTHLNHSTQDAEAKDYFSPRTPWATVESVSKKNKKTKVCLTLSSKATADSSFSLDTVMACR